MTVPPDAEEIVAVLAEEVSRLRPGERAPSEAEIMARFGISRSRTRQVVTALESGNLVQRRQGAGTFVTRVYEYEISDSVPASLHQTITRLGGEVRTVTTDVGSAIPPEWVAPALGVEPGASIPVITRLGHVDGRPAVHLREYLAPGVLDEVEIALRVIESVEEILCAAGFAPYRASCRGSVEIPPAQVCSNLGTRPAQQVWRVTSLLRDRGDGRPLLLSDNHSRTDVIRMVFGHGPDDLGERPPP